METSQSAFKFLRHRIVRSLIEVKDENKEAREFRIECAPSGIINNKTSEFLLNFKVKIIDKTNNVNIEVDTEAIFKFTHDSAQGELDNFFYINSSAILFPYIRAYIATLTTLSGESIVPPTLNLTNLGDELRKNTTTFNS
jgi:preprotein translocase subunit SecB